MQLNSDMGKTADCCPETVDDKSQLLSELLPFCQHCNVLVSVDLFSSSMIGPFFLFPFSKRSWSTCMVDTKESNRCMPVLLSTDVT